MDFIKNNWLAAAALIVGFLGLAVGVSASTSNTPLSDREWQWVEYGNRLNQWAEARASFVDEYITNFIDGQEAGHRQKVADYPSCVRERLRHGPAYNRCLNNVAGTLGHSWLYHEFGITAEDRIDTVFTDEQKAIILDWEQVKQIHIDNPHYMAGIHHRAAVAFESEQQIPKHDDHDWVYIDSHNRMPPFPLVGERPFEGITLAESGISVGDNPTGQFSISLNSRPKKPLLATISTEAESVRIWPITASWTVERWPDIRTIAVGGVDELAPDKAIIKVQVRYSDETEILFTETIEVLL